MHYLVNAVTEAKGSPAAVLIRALEPIEGIELMQKRRRGRAAIDVSALCRGPGNLTKALGISLAQNRLALTVPPLSIEDWGVSPGRVTWGPRIGIRSAPIGPGAAGSPGTSACRGGPIDGLSRAQDLRFAYTALESAGALLVEGDEPGVERARQHAIPTPRGSGRAAAGSIRIDRSRAAA
jgi:hypothetical protein